ncbi:hypothetical protein pb186bvf_012505 [Paramecium bursaria]
MYLFALIIQTLAKDDFISISQIHKGVLDSDPFTLNIPSEYRKLSSDHDLSFDISSDQPLNISIKPLKLDAPIWSYKANDNQIGLTISSYYFQQYQQYQLQIQSTVKNSKKDYSIFTYLGNNKNRIISKNQTEIGFAKKGEFISYMLLMQQEQSGKYMLQVEFMNGTGKIGLKNCSKNQAEVAKVKDVDEYLSNTNYDNYYNCKATPTDFNQHKITIDNSQVEFIYDSDECMKEPKTLKGESYPSNCAYTTSVYMNEDGAYKLNLFLFSKSQNHRPNQIVQYKVLNKEIEIFIKNQQQDVFFYFEDNVTGSVELNNQTVKNFDTKALIFQQFEQSHDSNDIYKLRVKTECPDTLNVQYIVDRTLIDLDKPKNIAQEPDQYQFYELATTLKRVQVEIFVYDTDLHYFAFISTSRSNQFPNENTHDLQMIDTNIQYVQVKEGIIFVAIKTKEIKLNYTITLSEVNLEQLKQDKPIQKVICRSCMQQFLYNALDEEALYLILSFDEAITYEQVKVSFIQEGSSPAIPNLYSSNSELREFIFNIKVKATSQNEIQIRTAIQVNVRISLTNQNIRSMNNGVEYTQLDNVQQYKINLSKQTKVFIHIFPFVEQFVEISSLSELHTIAQNVYSYKAINTTQLQFEVQKANLSQLKVQTVIYDEDSEQNLLYENLDFKTLQIKQQRNQLQITQNILKNDSIGIIYLKFVRGVSIQLCISNSAFQASLFDQFDQESLIISLSQISNYEQLNHTVNIANWHELFGKDFYIQIRYTFHVPPRELTFLTKVAKFEALQLPKSRWDQIDYEQYQTLGVLVILILFVLLVVIVAVYCKKISRIQQDKKKKNFFQSYDEEDGRLEQKNKETQDIV